MKTVWNLTYETIPGDGEQKKKYKSFDEAKKDIRNLISKIRIRHYTDAIREGVHTSFRTAIADFVDNYISRNEFFSDQDNLPSSSPDDYELETSALQNANYEDSEDDDSYYDDEVVDEFDDFEIDIDKDLLSFRYYYDDLELKTNMVVMDDENKDYYFQFFVYTDSKSKFKEVNIELEPLQCWGTSSYPLLILRILENARKPLTQEQIISLIEFDYGTKIERKAIGRNITLMKKLGYDIQHSSGGYYIPKKGTEIGQDDLQIIVESINANPYVDSVKKADLVFKLFKM
ncbi:MAG: hypothetical protein IKJ91_01200 [Clostridia bacterium]|nr:hypothetical protein [Clostridia bacterium]